MKHVRQIPRCFTRIANTSFMSLFFVIKWKTHIFFKYIALKIASSISADNVKGRFIIIVDRTNALYVW